MEICFPYERESFCVRNMRPARLLIINWRKRAANPGSLCSGLYDPLQWFEITERHQTDRQIQDIPPPA